MEGNGGNLSTQIINSQLILKRSIDKKNRKEEETIVSFFLSFNQKFIYSTHPWTNNCEKF